MRASHLFANGTALEGGYFRLHEPGPPSFRSFLDEAQLSFRTPEWNIINRPVVFSGTLSKNRMIDMYTQVEGLEISLKSLVSITLGAYLGQAEREEQNRNFSGFQISVAANAGPIGLSAGHLNGRVDQGYYRKTAIEASSLFFEKTLIPVTVVLTFEDRFFDFGNRGPVSDPIDERIYVLGLELHLEDVIFHLRASPPFDRILTFASGHKSHFSGAF